MNAFNVVSLNFVGGFLVDDQHLACFDIISAIFENVLEILFLNDAMKNVLILPVWKMTDVQYL